MKLTRPIQTFLFLLVRALVVQPVQDTKLHSSELSLLSSRSGSIDRLNQTSLSSNISANRVAVFCDGAEYGRDLVTDDCKDAITAIKRSTQQVVFGERSADPQTWDVGLPSRQIGSEYAVQGGLLASFVYYLTSKQYRGFAPSNWNLSLAGHPLLPPLLRYSKLPSPC